MKKNRLLNFILFIPFAMSIGAFILFIKYYFAINGKNAGEVTPLLEISLIRYRNIAIFCLILGLVLLVIKSIIDHMKVNNNEIIEYGVLDRISARKQENIKKYTYNESTIINDLLKDKILTAKFINSDIEDFKVKFKNYNEIDNSMVFIDLSDKKEKDEKYFDPRYFTKCKKCDGIISKDAVICVHCGEAQKEIKEEKKKSRFNPVKFAINMIIILLCIIISLLLLNKIHYQNQINRSNINLDTIKAVE